MDTFNFMLYVNDAVARLGIALRVINNIITLVHNNQVDRD